MFKSYLARLKDVIDVSNICTRQSYMKSRNFLLKRRLLQDFLPVVSGCRMKSIFPVVVHPEGVITQTKVDKKTIPRKKYRELVVEPLLKPGFFSLVAYCTAEEYDLSGLREALLRQDLYIPCEYHNEEPLQSSIGSALFAKAKYKVSTENRRIYYFREGSVVLWNFPEVERNSVLKFLKPFEVHSYDENIVLQEIEVMSYSYLSTTKNSFIDDGSIYIGKQLDRTKEEVNLDRYTVSNATALSVKLGIQEAILERYIAGIESLTEDLKYGHSLRITQPEVLRKSGQLFSLRHSINLSTDLLDTPDFYWDHESLEKLFQKYCSYFSLSRRTKVINEKLNHCVELIGLVSSHLSDKHHIRLEWMIIVLIMVEVGIEVVHFFK